MSHAEVGLVRCARTGVLLYCSFGPDHGCDEARRTGGSGCSGPDADAKSNLAIIVWDFLPNASVHISPNVEFVKYGDVRGAQVRSDMVPRLTLYYVWQ